MTSDQRDAVFSLESPDLEEGGGGGESETDEDLRENDDVAIPDTNEAEEEDDAEEEDLTTAVTVSATDAVTVALPAGSAVPVSVIPVDSDPKWHRMTEIVHQRPPPPPIDDSRRLFQRLWTDEDEIELLRGFLDYVTSHRGNNSSHPPDTAPFYELIKSKLQLEFNKNQLVEKLRRLKKKYRNVMSKISSGKEVFFKSPHDQSTFEISRKIWNQTGKIIGFEDNNVMDFEETNTTNGNYFNSPGSNPVEIDSENGVERRLTMSGSGGSRKRSRSRIGKIEEDSKPVVTPSDGNVPNPSNVNLNEPATAVIGGNVGVLIEETVKNCVSPLIKEMMNGTTSMMMAAMGGGGGGGLGHGFGSFSPMFTRPLGYGVEGGGGNKAVNDERWRKQQILELEVYSRRLELVQEQIRATLHELKTMPSGV
ncbi:transcription factor [Hirschfeldia incana]|nr:transcription factor [Hirschfeldia incana]